MPTPSEILFIATFRRFGPDERIPFTDDVEKWARAGLVDYETGVTPRGADLLASADAAGFDTSEVDEVKASELQPGDRFTAWKHAIYEAVSVAPEDEDGFTAIQAFDVRTGKHDYNVCHGPARTVVRISRGKPKLCTACNDTRRVPVIGDFTNPCPTCCPVQVDESAEVVRGRVASTAQDVQSVPRKADEPRRGDTLNYMVQGEAALSEDTVARLRRTVGLLDTQTLWLAAASGTPVELIAASVDAEQRQARERFVNPPYGVGLDGLPSATAYAQSPVTRGYTARVSKSLADTLRAPATHDLNPPGVDED